MIQHQVYIYDKRLPGTSARFAPDRIQRGPFSATTGPLVSCLMITRGDLGFVRAAISSFAAQTYGNRELMIICDAVTPDLVQLVADSGEDVRLVVAEQMSLGELRNLSVEQAQGEIVCQWDDDDIYGPQRLENGIGALLATGAEAVFLRQWMLWCPAQEKLSLSWSRVWEGTMIAYKDALPRYPDLHKAEDTALVLEMGKQRVIALMDDPMSYCYCMHGGNTFLGDHQQTMLNDAKLIFDYPAALAAFSSALKFAHHPALPEAHRPSLRGNPIASAVQRALLWAYMEGNQFARRYRYRAGTWPSR